MQEMAQQGRRIWGRLWLPALIAGIALLVLWLSLDLGETARRWPIAIAISLVVIMVADTLLPEPRTALPAHGQSASSSEEQERIVTFPVVLLVATGLSIVIVGLGAASFLLVGLYLRFTGERRPTVALTTAAVVAIVVYLFFNRLLGFELYPGILFT